MTPIVLAAWLVASAVQTAPMGQMKMPASPDSGWSIALDGNIFGTFDAQGGRRGDTAFVSQNWLMLMAAHPLGPGRLTFTLMGTAEPLTAPGRGYPEIFQEGEAYQGLQITDHQHPHDLVTQAAVAWRVPIAGVHLTLAGGPVGEAALGPVAFMHRPSSTDNPAAPLSHHIFDSTHVSEGVVFVGVDRGPVGVEASAFRGREPDEHHANIEFGALDSWSVRGWVQPARNWSAQASYGFLHQPEQLEPGDQRRANASVSFLRVHGDRVDSWFLAYGRNARTFSTVHAWLAEATEQWGDTAVFGRFEDLQVETEILLFPQIVHIPHPGELVDPIQAFTTGAERDLWHVGRWRLGAGADVTLYGVPPLLQATHGAHPVSAMVFVVVHPRSDHRMWDMTMGRPMAGMDDARHGGGV